jgi:hypothetical protein
MARLLHENQAAATIRLNREALAKIKGGYGYFLRPVVDGNYPVGVTDNRPFWKRFLR